MRSPLIPLLVALCAVGIACGSDKGGAPEAPEVVVAPVAKKDVEIASEWVGTLTGNVNAQIYPKVQGYLLKQAYKDGTPVKEGQLLFEIDPRQFQAALDEAKGRLERTQAALGKSELDVRRYTPLAAEGAVSQQELDDAIQMRAANRAQVASAKAALENARLNLEWTRVLAPISGIAAIATAQVGDLVSPQTLLTTVSQVDPIKVTWPISEIDYLRFAPRIQQRLESDDSAPGPELELILAGGERYPEPGHLSVTGLAVSETTGTIDVQGLFPNPNSLLRPGQFARIRVTTKRLPDALVIPQRAVRDLQGVSQVAVLDADDKATFRNIELGPATGSDVVVAKGLAAGDRIVVEGLQKIRDGGVVRPASGPDTSAVAAPPANRREPGAGH